MIARLVEREEVTDEQVAGLLGENILRAWSRAEIVAKETQQKGTKPVEAAWKNRIWEPVVDDVPRVFGSWEH